MNHSNPYDLMARTMGKRCVMNPRLNEQEHESETDRQLAEAKCAIAPLLDGYERLAIDYGCGYGRLTPLLSDIMPKASVIGYDPSEHMIRIAKLDPKILYTTERPSMAAYDVIMTWAVLGSPMVDRGALAKHMSELLIPGGLLIIGDHIGFRGRGWWEFKSEMFYQNLFDGYGISLQHLAEIGQAGDPFSLLYGRKT